MRAAARPDGDGRGDGGLVRGRDVTPRNPDIREWCVSCAGPVFIDEPGRRCPNCVRKRRESDDIRRRCQLCRGPIFRDEPPGTHCPDCRAARDSASETRRRVAGPVLRSDRLVVIRGEDRREGGVFRTDPVPAPVLYGLLTAADVLELERRRLLFGLALIRGASRA